MYRMSRFVCDPGVSSIDNEMRLAKESLRELFDLFPKAFMTIGNHDTRYIKQSFAAGISQAFLRRIEEILGCPEDWRICEFIEIDKVRYFHGEPFSGNSWVQAADKYGQSVCFGHVHSNAGVRYGKKPNGAQTFAANAGCLIDEKAYAFAYGKTVPSKPVIGTCVVLDNGKRAEFIPML